NRSIIIDEILKEKNYTIASIIESQNFLRTYYQRNLDEQKKIVSGLLSEALNIPYVIQIDETESNSEEIKIIYTGITSRKISSNINLEIKRNWSILNEIKNKLMNVKSENEIRGNELSKLENSNINELIKKCNVDTFKTIIINALTTHNGRYGKDKIKFEIKPTWDLIEISKYAEYLHETNVIVLYNALRDGLIDDFFVEYLLQNQSITDADYL